MKRKVLPYVPAILALALTGCAERAEAPPEVVRAAETEARAPAAGVPAAPAAAEEVALVEASAGEPRSGVTTAPAGDAGSPEGGARARPAAEQPAAPAADDQPAAQGILRRAERAYAGIRSLEADFVQEVTVPLLNSTQHSRGKLYHRRPDRFLMKFSQPEGDVVVADGEYLWMYYPSTDPKQVMRTRTGDGGQQVDLQKEFLSNATERFQAVLTGTESVGGRAADVLVLTPRAPAPYRRVRIWVDREDALVRRFEILEENESVRRLELRGLKPNVSLADQLFRFTPPPGAQIFEQ